MEKKMHPNRNAKAKNKPKNNNKKSNKRKCGNITTPFVETE
jgi:hypothetical protein